MRITRIIALLVVAGALAGCGGQGSAVAPMPNPPGHKSQGQATFTIKIPPKAAAAKMARFVHPFYISVSTQSIAITVNGTSTTLANLTPSSPGCSSSTGTLTCTVTAPSPDGSDTFGLTTYDSTCSGSTASTCGNALSTATVAATIQPGAANNIPVTMQGIIASIQLVLATTNPPQGTPTTIALTVNAMDADGNLIIGPGGYDNPIAIADSDSGYSSLTTSSEGPASSVTVPDPTTAASVVVNYNGGPLTSATFTASASGVTNIQNATLAPHVVIREYSIPTPNSGPFGITAGPDGNLWFTETSGNRIGSITTGGSVTEYPIPTSNSGPVGITAGSDGNLWFTEISGNKIASITTGGSVTEYPIPTSRSFPYGITAGPDGNLWFAENAGNKIGSITTGGSIAEYSIPTSHSGPLSIAAGPDGNLWFTEGGGNKVGSVTTNGTFTEYSIPTANNNPVGITAGPDGNLWFTEESGDKVGSITTGGSVADYSIPTSSSEPFGIAVGPDGNLWFPELSGNKIGTITTSGGIAEYMMPTLNSDPEFITAGPDGNLWFTFDNKIGVLIRTGPTATPQSLQFTAAGQTANFSVSESNYTGSFTARSSNLNCATVTAGPATTFTVTAVGADACTISATDSNGNVASVAVSVTTTVINPQAKRHHRGGLGNE